MEKFVKLSDVISLIRKVRSYWEEVYHNAEAEDDLSTAASASLRVLELKNLINDVGALPRHDAKKVSHWKRVYSNNVCNVYECAACHHISLTPDEHCVCGAEMEDTVYA